MRRDRHREVVRLPPMNSGDTHHTRLRRATAAIAVALVLVVTACGSSDDNDSSSDAATTTVDVAAGTAYVAKGPYSVGTTTLDLDGRKIEVWYPADAIPSGAQQVIFEIRDLLPENLKSVVPDDLNPKYPTDAYRDIAASEKGPFPLVLFAHGFVGLSDRVPVPADALWRAGAWSWPDRLQRTRSARRAERVDHHRRTRPR